MLVGAVLLAEDGGAVPDSVLAPLGKHLLTPYLKKNVIYRYNFQVDLFRKESRVEAPDPMGSDT